MIHSFFFLQINMTKCLQVVTILIHLNQTYSTNLRGEKKLHVPVIIRKWIPAKHVKNAHSNSSQT